jgi:hypothetical protein
MSQVHPADCSSHHGGWCDCGGPAATPGIDSGPVAGVTCRVCDAAGVPDVPVYLTPGTVTIDGGEVDGAVLVCRHGHRVGAAIPLRYDVIRIPLPPV